MFSRYNLCPRHGKKIPRGNFDKHEFSCKKLHFNYSRTENEKNTLIKGLCPVLSRTFGLA